ncbi:AN1-type zinc finger protein 3 isoform X1 [Globicephala melas]|uniref:AN1-type zinc finger protein 3 isoform X1 n=1 Tax=Globicephala melas TaxID=9731 RepID=UPI00293D9493|nr:AN1-type zinc finger protein 3 isoform X1 [Globicephala melas]
MGDAGSERSKAPSLPPRCPCGFWGSSKTMNLCSKCFADFQKKQPDDDSAPSTSNSQSDLFSEETTSDNSNTSITTPTLSPSQQPLPTELNVTSPSKEECGPCTDTAHVSLITPTKRSCGTDSQSENEASPVKRPRLLENTERPEETSRSKQKSRRRCFQCQTKLELVQQELGSCRCGVLSLQRPPGGCSEIWPSSSSLGHSTATWILCFLIRSCMMHTAWLFNRYALLPRTTELIFKYQSKSLQKLWHVFS